MRDVYYIIKKPIITEKTSMLREQNKYVFEVDKNANKIEIKKAVEKFFKVKVKKVNTTMIRGKKRRRGRIEGRTPDRKKAIVTLYPGEKIEAFEV
jgi:large subunit ribosomal protein L23